jgi:hypothetical protein
MKPKLLITCLAFLAFGLITAIACVHWFGSTASTSQEVKAQSSATSAEAQSSIPAPADPPAPAEPQLSWRDLESEDYHKYIANLRAFGCPEQTIRDLVIADINKLYADREKPLKSKPQPTPDNPAGETDQQKLDRLQKLRALQQEKRWAVKELLGIDIPLDLLPSSGSRDYHAFELAFKYLPAEKRDAVQFLQESYWQQSDALKTKYPNTRSAEYVAESRQLKDTMRQELAKILTPQELEDFDLRTSTTAKQLSANLATYFRPTEEEFRQLYRASRDREEALERLAASTTQPTQPVDPNNPKALAQQRAAERQARELARNAIVDKSNEQLKTALGEERYTEYQRSQDRTYDLLARLGTRYNLSQEAVLQAYELQKSFKPGAEGQPANKAEQQQKLTEQLTAILGEQAVRGYRRVNGGSIPIN